ncbi:hypothetical protein [Glaciimonas sp. PAMC28666]|uniref:hypothetical protein n=1 Tax=Glaciimonas sp. PAMC28666 TaxID=2807626 RepID=UPI001F050464|nr:hypothetical protein [Glaciimonas sp. PAMC28666]
MDQPHQVRSKIAAIAARFIAEDGADYGTAKLKAAQQLLGNKRISSDLMPDNSQIEEEVHLYNTLFFAETQPIRLLHLRKIAVEVMTDLTPFSPYLTGAVCNGTAGEHSDIHLQLFVESPKDVEIYLLNKNVQFSVSDLESNYHTAKGSRGKSDNRSAEILHFVYKNEGIHLTLYETDALRGSIRPAKTASGRRERADLPTARLLLEEQTILLSRK